MGLPVIGLVVRMVGNGVGLAQEARAHHREQKTLQSLDNLSVSGEPSRSKGPARSPSPSARPSPGQLEFGGPPPAYTEEFAELPQEEAEKLIAKGEAVPIEVRVHDSDSDDSDDSDEVERPSEKEELKENDSKNETLLEEDEADWALDDAAGSDAEEQSPTSPEYKKKIGIDAQETIQSLGARVMVSCPPPLRYVARMPYPVILPQRRPGQKDRGFIRAYAPVLANNGISQDTFLSFLKNLHTASQASPILNVVYLGAGVVGFVPGLATMITSMTVQVAVGAAMELQKRQRTNGFLDEMNEHLFKPRGLFALVMSYKPDAARPIDAQALDTTSMISRRSEQDSHTLRGAFKLGSGATYGELELPEAAPLMFPGLERATSPTGSAEEAVKEENRLKKSKKFIDDYQDRRAQAIYAKQNPESSLQLPPEERKAFASQWSDPNSTVHNGKIITLVTGGKVGGTAKADRKDAKRDRKNLKRQLKDIRKYGQPVHAPKPYKRRGMKGKRAMKKGVFYLMIVNMPTDAEISLAKETLQQQQLQRVR